jgi:hypothetical protein
LFDVQTGEGEMAMLLLLFRARNHCSLPSKEDVTSLFSEMRCALLPLPPYTFSLFPPAFPCVYVCPNRPCGSGMIRRWQERMYGTIKRRSLGSSSGNGSIIIELNLMH